MLQDIYPSNTKLEGSAVAMEDWQEEYIRNVKQEAASNPVIVEAMRIWGMTWEDEYRLRVYLYPPTFIYNTANTSDYKVDCKPATPSGS